MDNVLACVYITNLLKNKNALEILSAKPYNKIEPTNPTQKKQDCL